MSEQTWTRWADEGGMMFQCEALEHGALKFSIMESNGTLEGTKEVQSVTLANFRVAQFKQWLALPDHTAARDLAAAVEALREIARPVRTHELGRTPAQVVARAFFVQHPEYAGGDA